MGDIAGTFYRSLATRMEFGMIQSQRYWSFLPVVSRGFLTGIQRR